MAEEPESLRKRAAKYSLAGALAFIVIELLSFACQGGWATLGLQPEKLMTYEVASQTPAGEEARGYEASLDHPKRIETLAFALPSGSAYVFLSDEGHAVPYALDPKGSDMPSGEGVSPFRIHPYGEVSSLVVVPTDADVVIDEVLINEPIPFEPSPLRLALIAALVAFLFAFSQKSGLFARPAFDEAHPRTMRVPRIILVVLLCACYGLGCFIDKSWAGSWSSEDGRLEYAHAYGHHAQYADLARSFAEGKVELPYEAEGFLLEMDNPYDPSARARASAESGSSYRWDTAYYEGRYYCYFGVLPVLVLYLPFYALTGTDMPSYLAAAISVALFVVGSASLLLSAVRRWFPHTSFGLYALLLVGGIASSMVIWCAARPLLYTVPVALGLALVAWGLSCCVRARKRAALWAAGVLLLSLTLAARPQLFAYALLALPLFVKALRDVGGYRRRTSLLAAAFVPFIVVASALMAYNAVRFGSPFDFGANYNLTTNDMAHRPRSVELVVCSLFYYFLQLPSLGVEFPFIMPVSTVFPYEGELISEASYGGLLWLAPFTLLGALGLAAKERRLRIAVASMIVLCIVIAAFDGLAAGMLSRYAMDFALMLSLSAAASVLCTARAGRLSDALRRVLVFVVVVGLFFNLMILYSGSPGPLVGFSALERAFDIL